MVGEDFLRKPAASVEAKTAARAPYAIAEVGVIVKKSVLYCTQMAELSEALKPLRNRCIDWAL